MACLVKPGQRYIACFETLAQLALLQATHSHIGGGRNSFSMPSGTDHSATEASLNKLFTTSWPLQLFVQLTAFWAHAHNVLLQPTHVPGRNNDWANDLSRGRLARFSHRLESRVRFSPAGLALSGSGIQLCPILRPGARNILQLPPAACSQALLRPNMHCDPTSPWQPECFAEGKEPRRGHRTWRCPRSRRTLQAPSWAPALASKPHTNRCRSALKSMAFYSALALSCFARCMGCWLRSPTKPSFLWTTFCAHSSEIARQICLPWWCLSFALLRRQFHGKRRNSRTALFGAAGRSTSPTAPFSSCPLS